MPIPYQKRGTLNAGVNASRTMMGKALLMEWNLSKETGDVKICIQEVRFWFLMKDNLW
jgi:hypothetical protein